MGTSERSFSNQVLESLQRELKVYAEGPARPTRGAATIAMLVGSDAPIAFESKLRGSHMSHAYDFYKPNLAIQLLMESSHRHVISWHLILAISFSVRNLKNWKGGLFQCQMLIILFFILLIYNKLVQKSFSRLYFNKFLRNPSFVDEAAKETLAPHTSLSSDESYHSCDLEKGMF